MKVIINNEEFELSNEKMNEPTKELNVFEYKFKLYADKNYLIEFKSSDDSSIVMYKVEDTKSGQFAVLPIMVESYNTTPELFLQEIKNQLTPYLK